jgi:hypothetical protein
MVNNIVLRNVNKADSTCEVLLIDGDYEIQTFVGKYSQELIDFINEWNGFMCENNEDLVKELDRLLVTQAYFDRIELEKIENELKNLIVEIDVAKILEKLGEDFVYDGVGVHHINSNIYLPSSFMYTILEEYDIKPYVNFWKRLCLNPVKHVAQNLFNWIMEHGLKITEHGLLIGYRGAVKYQQNSNLPIDEVYWKCKNAKKGVLSHGLFLTNDGKYTYRNLNNHYGDGEFVSTDNLQTLLDNNFKSNVYTHWYNAPTKLYFELNKVYRDINKVSTDSSKDCAPAIHIGNLNFGISNFGDTLLGCLFCPSKVASVPDSNTNKLRCYEIFPFVEFENESSMIDFHNENKVIQSEIDYLKQIDESFKNDLKEMVTIIEDNDDLLINELNTKKAVLLENMNKELKNSIEHIKSLLNEKTIWR